MSSDKVNIVNIRASDRRVRNVLHNRCVYIDAVQIDALPAKTNAYAVLQCHFVEGQRRRYATLNIVSVVLLLLGEPAGTSPIAYILGRRTI